MLMILIGTTFVVVLLEICLDLSVDTQVYTQMGVEDGGDVGDVSWCDLGDGDFGDVGDVIWVCHPGVHPDGGGKELGGE